ncbi:MAG: FHA domain-containing protein [Planctomycetes bacterium]|nr:FHA domain-containing protein [Planctomycetota bacterium]
MENEGPILIGIAGLIEGEQYPLQYGQSVVIGRSRSCDISLRKCARWQELPPEERNEEKDFKTVSRKHVRITFYNANSIEIEDLSSNGTFVDGQRVDRVLISDIKERDHEIQLGTQERFRLSWRKPA